ncbi:hypothetical protein L249_4025, partial [Ophiocordyceps polyrhachis-furcata BCC 54312]
LREILLALYITLTPKAPLILSLLFKIFNFTNLFSKEKASALLLYYMRYPPNRLVCTVQLLRIDTKAANSLTCTGAWEERSSSRPSRGTVKLKEGKKKNKVGSGEEGAKTAGSEDFSTLNWDGRD